MKVRTELDRQRQRKLNESKYFDYPMEALYERKGELLLDVNRIVDTLDIEKPKVEEGFWELDMKYIQEAHPEAFPPLELLLSRIGECDSVIILLRDYQKIMVDFV